MTFEVIDSPEPNFPVNIFTPDEDTTDGSDSDWIAISCCSYNLHPIGIDSIWVTDADK